MKIYLIPYAQTELENIVEVSGLDPLFYDEEIIGDHPIEYGSLYAENVIDIICEIKNMVNSSQPAIDSMLIDFKLTDVDFEFTPDQIECGLFVPKNLIGEIPFDLLDKNHYLIFPDSRFLNMRNGIFEINH